ncbi:3998_t:CDS:1, partial [Gigaspora margarita]
ETRTGRIEEEQRRTIQFLREENDDLQNNYERLLDLYWNNVILTNNIAN